ncbi:monocarboxylate transporter 14 [Canis lupus baileyi]|uniref:Solute carrier family 16 member 14 n=2 Tax=Canis lupus TaxID=9612 RepID=A0A8C0P0W4_CANLF|nr:monocarboxylate transporter 14 [Canis lupus familiaris]XP_543280.2 monocarboxylate transporter 14 [Canis lupus familiaris]|eukprot:XP_022265355.1 monocarboxylate transporter 14 [Canis lupus familiaris]
MYTSHEDIGYDFEDDPKDKKTLKSHPNIDSGWAWMVVLSSFFVHILIMGSQMALGVLNVEWLEEFHQSRGLTAWVSSLSMGITLIVGPFIGLFINTCGCRGTAIIGGLVNSLGWVLSAYAANVHYLFITFGVTAGLGSGMAYLPAVVMVGRYFQKRRALAQGLSTTGTGFGTFLMTLLLKHLCAEYGWRDAMFIQGAVSLNLCVCGALLRPLAARGDPEGPGGEAPARPPGPGPGPGPGAAGPEEQAGEPRGALGVLKTAGRLGRRVRKGFRDWSSGYFGTASLFTNRRFVAFILWALFAYSSFVIPFIHLPEIVHLYRLSEQNDVFPLTSIIAIVHILAKVILGVVADLPCIRVWNVFLMANFTLVLSIFILPLMHTYAGLAVICALIGFSSGYFSLMPVVTEDLVGIEHLANAYGIIICANGISALLGPPFAGWIYDITEKYDFSFYICGLLYMVGILFLLIQPCIQMIEQSRKKYLDGAHV